MEEINKKEIDDNVAVDTDVDAEQCFNKLKKRVTISESKPTFDPSAKKNWSITAYDAMKFNARAGLMIKIAQNTCNMIHMYILCAEANDPITSKEYIKLVKDNIEWFLEYYTEFENIEKHYPMFFDLAIGDKKIQAKHYANRALKDSLDFMECMEKDDLDFMKRLEAEE
nr:MAG TPA: hypothetical protein [Caudoviricetes sp.]